MGQLADMLGLGTEFDYNGKRYTIGQLQIKHRGMFEIRLEKEGWDAIERSRPYSTAGQMRERIALFTRDIASYQLSYGSEAYRKASASMQGVQYLTFLALRENHPEIDEGFVADLIEEKIELFKRLADSSGAIPKQEQGQDDEPATAEPDCSIGD